MWHVSFCDKLLPAGWNLQRLYTSYVVLNTSVNIKHSVQFKDKIMTYIEELSQICLEI